MKLRLYPLAALALAPLFFAAPVFAADAQAGVTVVTELAQVNGQALACQAMDAVARAKKLMLAHAPKTPRFGTLYEESTNAGYLEQLRTGAPCPDAAGFNDKLDALAKRLADTLPAGAAEAK